MNPLYNPLPFSPSPPALETIHNGPPKEFDIFYSSEADFLPEGKSFDSLTKEEIKRLKDQYRFAPEKPGQYQGITGISHGITGSIL